MTLMLELQLAAGMMLTRLVLRASPMCCYKLRLVATCTPVAVTTGRSIAVKGSSDWGPWLQHLQVFSWFGFIRQPIGFVFTCGRTRYNIAHDTHL